MIQFGAVLKDNRGRDLQGEGGAPLTLARACESALDATLQADQAEGLKPKLRRGRLIEEINAAANDLKPLALEADDIALLKDRVALMGWPASVVRTVCLLLDPATKE